MNFDSTQTVAEIAREYTAAVPVFEAFGIDYCCGGNRPLEVACARQNVSLNVVLSNLSSALVTRPTEDERHWMVAPLAEVAEHIVGEHHSYARRELPRVAALAAKVETRHGYAFPETHEIRELIEAMSSEMFTHMLKEEEVLFPRLKAVEEAAEAGKKPQPALFGAPINPIRHMMNDHDDTGLVLKSLRRLTHRHRPPADACMSFQALYHGLEALEKDLHQHIHLENNILFPRALTFEKVN
jgi:regulator of cell morphogenesis and NO signaling